MALMMPATGGEERRFCLLLRWFTAMFDKCRTVKTRILARRRGGIGWRAAFINRRGVMRKFAPLPKSILLVEILGMGLLTLAPALP